MKFVSSLLCIGMLFATTMRSQIDSSLTFSTWKGEAYDIPYKIISEGYSPDLLEYPFVGHLTLEELDIPIRHENTPLEGIPMTSPKGFVFHSKVSVPLDGPYEFSISSDDGSKLWLNDSLLIDHDGSHQFMAKADTTYLFAGDYDVRIWYSQAFPDRYGLVLDTRYVVLPTPDSLAEVSFYHRTEITLNDTLLYFDHNEAAIQEQYQSLLAHIAGQVKDLEIRHLEIIGHTDQTGSPDYNADLGLRRAEAVRNGLLRHLDQHHTIIDIQSMGENDLITTANDERSLALNRRVVIRIKSDSKTDH